jgi:hypothetical protein
LAGKNLFVGQPQNADAFGSPEFLIALEVLLSVVVRTIDLHDEVSFRQVEIHDAVVGLEKPVLEPIGKSERSEVVTETSSLLAWPAFAIEQRRSYGVCRAVAG